MTILRYAAFSNGGKGGNPAGVLIGDALPEREEMQRIAAEVGYSETAFAAKNGANDYIVRYFSPESEVPFCGHATIALGAALAEHAGAGIYSLKLRDAEITVEGTLDDEGASAALQSPPTKSRPADPALLAGALDLFDLSPADLDPAIPAAFTEAGATHLVIALADRARLAAIDYDLDSGRQFMRHWNLVTINLIHMISKQRIASRNAFASGGVLEDPATGAAAAALAGYLRDIGWPHGGRIEISQGEDMGSPSHIVAEIPIEAGSSIRVSGRAHRI